ncbi:unnamed protein product [Lasius platythorax]|uniref:Uncharacterized protein n=1 Tax=Lasius platythorax TaxID=488582 RepID=A0AAV2N4W1_9HYME
MRPNIMKFSFTIIIFVCWSTLLTANDVEISLEFPNYMNEFGHQCKDDISLNFSNSMITFIGQNFISNPLITCLNLMGTHINSIQWGAFNKLPNLTQLFISNNNIELDQLFTFGSHENLTVLILNSATNTQHSYHQSNTRIVDISEEYPNLEILSLRTNNIEGLQISTEKTPFPKLKILDLSSNNIKATNFTELLPNSLYFLDLHDNSLTSFTFDKTQVNFLRLNLDNNNLKHVKKYDYSRDSSDSYNPHNQYNRHNYRHRGFDYMDYDPYNQYNSENPQYFGLIMAGLENLHYLSISGNNIDFIESNAFENTTKLVYLNLSTNNISYLHPKIFEKLQSLRSLDLSLNKLEDVPQISSETITTLSLNCNNIKSLISKAFLQMPKLTKLLLGGNQIVEINIKAFAQPSLLEILDLSRNKLSFLPEEWSESFTSLKYLNLNDNQFTSLESLSLTSALPLMEVYLAMNPLEYLDVNYCKNLPQNLTVNLVQGSSFAYWNSNKCNSK